MSRLSNREGADGSSCRHEDRHEGRPDDLTPADGDELQAGLRLVLGTAGRPASDVALLNFLRLAVKRRLDLNALRVVRKGRRVGFAVLPLAGGGGSGMLMCPAVLGGVESGRAADAVRAAADALRDGGTEMVQLMVDPRVRGADGVEAAAGHAGLVRLTDMDYLRRTCPRGTPRLHPPPGYEALPYTPSTHALFLEALEATYDGSLDCHELNGRRRMEDILAVHRDAGGFSPGWWTVWVRDGRPAGILLLAGQGAPERPDGLELVYVGLHPEHRGHGVGDRMLHEARWQAAQTTRRELALAVDVRNAPARRLYARHGMRSYDLRRVYYRIGPGTVPASPQPGDPVGRDAAAPPTGA